MAANQPAADNGEVTMKSPKELPFVDLHGRPTLRTVAHLAGVHISTVSRVLNPTGETEAHSASSETSERILRIAAELDYSRNPHASSLRTRRSTIVGVLVPRLSDIVLATIYEGIEEAAAAHGYYTFVANSRDQPEGQREKIEMLLSRRVDGLILGDARNDGKLVGELKKRKVPFVLVNRRVPPHPSVTCDDVLGGRLAADHLLSLGHTDLAVIAGEPYASTGVDRTRGFLDRCAEAGVPVPASRVLHSAFDVAGGRRAADVLLAPKRRPSAIFAVNDFAAIGALGAVRDRGLQAGKEVAIVGFNDVPLAAELPIPLTSVRSPMNQMGYRGFELLIDQLAGRSVESLLLQPELFIRSSSTGEEGD